MVVHLNPRLLFGWACVVIAALGVMHVVGWSLMLAEVSFAHSDGLMFPLLDLDTETGLGTYYATVQLTFVALLTLGTGLHVRRIGGPMPALWLAMGTLLLLVAINEHLTVRETISKEHHVQLRGVWISSWVLPGIVVVLVLGMLFWRFLRRLPGPIGGLVMFGAVVYTVGSIGFELLANWINARIGYGRAWSFAALAEETFELLGVAIVGYTTARYLQDFLDPVSITSEAAGDSESESISNADRTTVGR